MLDSKLLQFWHSFKVGKILHGKIQKDAEKS